MWLSDSDGGIVYSGYLGVLATVDISNLSAGSRSDKHDMSPLVKTDKVADLEGVGWAKTKTIGIRGETVGGNGPGAKLTKTLVGVDYLEVNPLSAGVTVDMVEEVVNKT